MNEEPPTAESQAAPESEPAQTPPPAPAPVATLPPWLPYLALAVVPALVVGLLVYALAGNGGGGGGTAAGIIDGFFRLSADANTEVERYKGAMPRDFPSEFPRYRGASPVVSFTIKTPEGTNYFVVLTTSARAEDVLAFYHRELDVDPWQVEIGQASRDIQGIQFSRPDNPDISGVITVRHSDLDNTTTIFLSYEDISASLPPGTGSTPFTLGRSRPLPPGFPNDVPIYESNQSIVLDTYFQRGQGGQLYAVTFLTRDSQDDVINFYTDEFEKRGWTTRDTSPGGTSFAVSIDFSDTDQRLSGEITADAFQDDSSFTRVDVLVQVSPGRN